MEHEIDDLTRKMVQLCAGENLGAVVGAGFNVIQTAINHVNDRKVLLAVAATLKNQADVIERLAVGERH